MACCMLCDAGVEVTCMHAGIPSCLCEHIIYSSHNMMAHAHGSGPL